MASSFGQRLRAALRWASSPQKVKCPVCEKKIDVAPNQMGPSAVDVTIPRSVEELVAACAAQHGVRHTDAELQRARQEGAWRP